MLSAWTTARGLSDVRALQDAAAVRSTWTTVVALLGEDDDVQAEVYARALEQLLVAVEVARPKDPPDAVVLAFRGPWSALRETVEGRGDAGLTDAFRAHAEALQRFLEARPPVPGAGRTWQVPRDGDLSAVYQKAGWGDGVRVQGRLPRARLERAAAGDGTPAPIRILGPATLQQNPVGGSSTLSVRRASHTILEKLDLELDDTAAVMFQTRTGYRSIHFLECRIGLAAGKGWNAETDEGYRGKWGVLAYELDDFRFEDGEVVGVDKEHCFYLHNPHASGPDADAIVIRGTTMKWAGRTAVQVTSRRHEGPDGRGNVRIEDCVIEDVCLEGGGGGSALTFRGNLDGTVTIRNTRVQLGGNPNLHHTVNKNITGALVMDAGPGTDGRGTRELVIDGCHFEVGPHFTGQGSAQRTNVNISDVDRCTIRASTIIHHSAARPALGLDGHSIGALILDAGNDVRGGCTLEGLGSFKDPEWDGSGYRALLRAVEEAKALPEEDPRRIIADKVEILPVPDEDQGKNEG